MHTKYWAVLMIAAGLLAGQARAADDHAQEDIEKQLSEARQKLEDAAHQVAELSTQLGKPLVDRLMLMGEGPAHAIIGVQLDSNPSKDGAHVRDVSPGGPAAEAGIRAGDVIVSVNGTTVKTEHAPADVARLMRNVEPNARVKLRVLRAGKPLDFEVTARPVGNAWGIPGMPPHPEMALEAFGPDFMGHLRHSVAGMELVTLTPGLGEYFGTDKGVLVLRAPRSTAFNLHDGDVILSIDGRAPTSGSHATRILGSYQPGEKVTLQLMRQHKKMSVEAKMPERHHGPSESLASADNEEDQ